MNTLLWTIVVLGAGEMVTTTYYALRHRVPERTASGMAWNAALMMSLAAWAFWLLVKS